MHFHVSKLKNKLNFATLLRLCLNLILHKNLRQYSVGQALFEDKSKKWTNKTTEKGLLK